MKITALIQARMGSTRLPCKMMLCLHGAPLIDWVIQRTARAQKVNSIIVATSTTPTDDVLAEHLQKQQVKVFRGDEADVLGRFHAAATQDGATHIIRICADNPLIWGEEIDRLITEYFERQEEGCDYAYNHIPRGNQYPDGLGAEMISYALLDKLHKTATRPEHREHCLSAIWDNKDAYRIHTFDPASPALWRPDVKLDIDTAADYRKLALLPINIESTPAEIVDVYKEF